MFSGWLSGRVGQFGQFLEGEEAVWVVCARAVPMPSSARKCVLTYLRDYGTLSIEVRAMPKLTLFVPEELHEKLRWLSYKQHRSQQAILLEMVEKVLAKVEVPKEVQK